MQGYIYETEMGAVTARTHAAAHMGLPNPTGDTLYWVNYNYSGLDNFYYIQYVEGLDLVLGQPSEFEITLPE
jgi:hypothetical protein